MTELNLIQHIVRHLILQIQDYVEVRNRMSRAELLQVLSQFEERYSAKKAQGSSKNYNRKIRYWDVRRKSSYDRRNRNWRDVEGLDRQNDRSGDFQVVDRLLFYVKYATTLEELRVYIPQSLQNEIMREFHDKPIASHFEKTPGKTPAVLVLDRNIIIPVQKLVMVSGGAEFVVGNIEKWLKEARQITRVKQEKWVKYYNKGEVMLT
ncbi:hypothetical protein TNCV_147021 [Trichonephila clavipes]|nr:hypothetical protein TNCV_147021 [Trichonephila clavipes]